MDATLFQVSCIDCILSSAPLHSPSNNSHGIKLLVPDCEIQKLSLVVDVFYLEEITGLCPPIWIYIPSSNTISHLTLLVAGPKPLWTRLCSLFYLQDKSSHRNNTELSHVGSSFVLNWVSSSSVTSWHNIAIIHYQYNKFSHRQCAVTTVTDGDPVLVRHLCRLVRWL